MRKHDPILLAAALVLATLLSAAPPAPAAVKSVPVGVKFTHQAPGAGQVNLAGSFNGWDAQRHPLTDEGGGVWSIVMALKPGKYEYKFVVDGAWFADAENPDSAPDSYGGTNSAIQVGDDGKLVAMAPTAARASVGTALNPKLTYSGRYLGRYLAWKDRDGDPRFRLERPEQNVDLNFNTKVSDIVDVYTRLRLDNTSNDVLNNIHAQLDEGAVDVHPGPFRVLGYWDMEALQLGDPLSSGGDVDLPGTILDDHLEAGKGTAGVVVSGAPFGLLYEGFFADVHDADYYNDINLYDNTGRDIFGSRLSRRALGLEFGVPLYMQRELVWVEMTSRLGQPDGTGIAALDRYLDRTGDTSDWFELDRLDMRLGFDLTRELSGGRGRAQLEWLYAAADERFVTGNRAGFNNTNGRADVDLSTRASRIWHASLEQTLRPGRKLSLEHTYRNESGAQPGEVSTGFLFLDQASASNRVYIEFGAARPALSYEYSELTWREEAEDRSHLLWVQRHAVTADYAAAGVASAAGAPTADATIWVVATRHTLGVPGDRWGRWDLEGAWSDSDDDITPLHGRTLELIVRADRQVSRRMHALANLRWIDYHVDDAAGGNDDFFAPWLGLQYLPSPRLDVTFFYGLDPLDFGIDYDGREIGRWRYRRQYVQDHAGATDLDAERSLEDVQVLGIRANMRF
ncbi:MAG: glycogen-binding domain-containing protein [Candidatus Latescibacteria bacterium]|nr:glycogen-binding domain-containing protein [Candidatus Latescibacterota bacterium]